jgi:ParB/RepB/Spo0J family partition protein
MDGQAQVTAGVAFRSLPLEQLRPSTTEAQTQRRKYFDKAKLDELAESIVARGVLQPIVVRYFAPDKAAGVAVPAYYEIVAGERRFLASKLAKRADIPAVVLELSDEEVIEVQREDVHPMQEAEGYHELVTKFGHAVDELPARVGKSRSYVYARIKLLALCAKARDAFYKGGLTASTALLVARIAGDEDQERALAHITERDYHDNVMSYRDAQAYIHDTFMLKLSTAPFPRDDPTLVPSAGACGPCPMRSGNARDLFDDVKGADVCTNPSCFKAKKAAHVKRELLQAREGGVEVIAGGNARKVLPKETIYSYSSDGSHKQLRNGYARPNDKCLDDPKKRTYAELAGNGAPKVLLQNPDTGRVEKIYKLDDIKDRLKDKGVSAKQPKDEEAKRRRNNERAAAELELERVARPAIFSAILEAAPKKLDKDSLLVIVTALLDESCCNDDELAMLELGKPKGDREKWLGQQLAKLNEAKLSQLAIAATVLQDAADDWGDSDRLDALAKQLGIDTKKMRAELAKPEEQAQAAAAGKKAKKR